MCVIVRENDESNKEEQCSRFSHWSETLRGQRSVACSQTGGQRKYRESPSPRKLRPDAASSFTREERARHNKSNDPTSW
ncbi:hypothetical protein PFLUV_G00063190 [Perca fluviatilis]|uniref:Uncharacterized protein n=1 Tax=Perca fluviatilis TaxID=8168 RepID=A0A6A5ENK0_PERFL|nr:hypothetical protein PFLUV_G00063190 [Perca fluviatilis]